MVFGPVKQVHFENAAESTKTKAKHKLPDNIGNIHCIKPSLKSMSHRWRQRY